MAVQKIGSGGTVIVRTGQLAGIGPVGPPGAKGDPGPAGPTGVQGLAGPAGSVTEHISITQVAAAQSIGPSDEIEVAMGTTEVDQGALWQSTTVFEVTEGNYLLNAWVLFDLPASPATGQRELTLIEDVSGSETVIDRCSVPAVEDDDTCVKLSMAFVGDPNATYFLRARSTDALSVAIAGGRVSINRVGPGAEGPEGPEGPAGPVGPVGPQGPQGDDGSASSGFDSFEDLISP